MLRGAHAIIYSTDAEADRTFFREVLECPFVDAGHGWLIFALPPAEVAVHPAGENNRHELFLMCDDVHAFRATMAAKGVASSDIREERWGSITEITLPGGGRIGVYQPKHPSPATTDSSASPQPASSRMSAAASPTSRSTPRSTAATRRACD